MASNTLVTFTDPRPPSACAASPLQMCISTEEAPIATEEFTENEKSKPPHWPERSQISGTTTVNSSPSKLPNSGRNNGSNFRNPKRVTSDGTNADNENNNQRNTNQRQIPCCCVWALVVLLTGAVFVLSVLLYQCYERHGGGSLRKWPKQFLSMEAQFKRAVVVSENGICSEIGRRILLQGGNAVDAALSVGFCVGALNPQSAGLGGGFLMTHYQRFYGKCTTIDARETAPARTNKDTFENATEEETQFGYKAVATPGLLHGFWTAFKRFGSGKIAWMDLLMPTVEWLTDGFPVSKLMENTLEQNRVRIINGSHPGMRNQFVNPTTGDLFKEGQLMRDSVLSETLKQLALSHEPVQLFYGPNGEIAKHIAEEFTDNGGFITKKDLVSYRTVVDEQPLLVTSDTEPKFVFCGAKPSSSFAITQLILAVMLKFYPPGSSATTQWDSNLFFSRLIEVQKRAFAMRSKLGDVKFDNISEEVALNMSRSEYVDEIVKEIDRVGVTKWEAFVESMKEYAPEDTGGTTQVIVVDDDGNAVSMTSSINRAFGSVIRSPRLGLIWNDHMDDFSQPNRTNFYGLSPSRTNFIEPGKRPMSSMSPTIVYQKESKKVKIVIGASGGTMIPTAMSQVLVQLLAFNHSVKEAIDTPRVHHQLTPFSSDFEREFPQSLVESLQNRGHNTTTNPRTYSASVQAVLVDSEGTLMANNDHRKKVHSYPVGY